MTSAQRILIIGAGAIGQLYGSHLAQQGHQVNVLLRSTVAPPLPPARITPLVGSDWYWQPQLATPNSMAQFDLILVTTKAHQVAQAIAPLPSVLPEHCCVLLMCNGMGAHQALLEKWPGLPLLLATSRHGVTRTSPWHITHRGQGATAIGSYTEQHRQQAAYWHRYLAAALPPCTLSNDIMSELWAKLAINCVINPFTALHNVDNGVLCEMRHRAWLSALCSELTAVMNAAGQHVSSTQLQARVLHVAEATASNCSSMRADVLAGRYTEIDYINGYVLALADRYHITAPLNAQLVAAIKQYDAAIS